MNQVDAEQVVPSKGLESQHLLHLVAAAWWAGMVRRRLPQTEVLPVGKDRAPAGGTFRGSSANVLFDCLPISLVLPRRGREVVIWGRFGASVLWFRRGFRGFSD
jgi:hypothetical protein